MNNRFVFVFFITTLFGSIIISGTESISYTYKAIYHGIAMSLWLLVILFGVIDYFRKKGLYH